MVRVFVIEVISMIDMRTNDKRENNTRKYVRRHNPRCPKCGKALSNSKFNHFLCRDCNQIYDKIKKEDGSYKVGKKL